jgi:NhaP-type Na+/H+ or K+/H+ antiporter
VSALAPRRAADAIFAVGSAILAAAVYVDARDIPESPFDPLGSAAFPLALAGLLAALAIVQLARLAFGAATGASSVALVHGLDDEGAHRRRIDLAAAIFALTVVYAIALAAGIGFLAATVVYIAAAGAALTLRDRRAAAKAAGIGAVLGVAIWFLFTHVFLLQWP